MKTLELLPPKDMAVAAVRTQSSGPLCFTIEEARREARKLRRYREELRSRRTMQETVVRTSPGREA